MHAVVTAALIMTALAMLAYVAIYTVVYPWWRSPYGRSLVLWPLIVSAGPGTFGLLRFLGVPVDDTLVLLWCGALVAATVHRFRLLIGALNANRDQKPST